MGKTVRFDAWNDEDMTFDRNAIKRLKKQQKSKRKEKEEFMNSGVFNVEVEEMEGQ